MGETNRPFGARRKRKGLAEHALQLHYLRFLSFAPTYKDNEGFKPLRLESFHYLAYYDILNSNYLYYTNTDIRVFKGCKTLLACKLAALSNTFDGEKLFEVID